MGYYTRHELDTNSWANEESLIAELRSMSEEAAYSIDEYGESAERSKWYGHERDLKKLSAAHPEVLFTLRGEGEEPGDLWLEYYKGGKVQHESAEIVFGEFDESKLV